MNLNTCSFVLNTIALRSKYRNLLTEPCLDPAAPSELPGCEDGNVECADCRVEAEGLRGQEEPQLLSLVTDGPVGMEDLVDSLDLFIVDKRSNLFQSGLRSSLHLSRVLHGKEINSVKYKISVWEENLSFYHFNFVGIIGFFQA